MRHIASSNTWPRPLSVFGYDDTIAVAGDLFEAETDCVREHNMGQIASDGCSNLAFFSREPEIMQPLSQPPELPDSGEPFNNSNTYISFLVGDGDNLNFVKGSRYEWMQNRVRSCESNPAGCYPLTWTLSPATLKVSPGISRCLGFHCCP